MRPRHEAVRRRLVATVALAPPLWATLAVPAAAEDGPASPGGPAGAGADAAAVATEVRLLTGDLVTVRAFPDGHEGIEVDLAERSGGEPVSCEILRRDSGTYVIPSDAWPLLPETHVFLHDQRGRRARGLYERRVQPGRRRYERQSDIFVRYRGEE